MIIGVERALGARRKGSHEHRSKGLPSQHSSLYEITSSSRRGDISNGHAELGRTGAVSWPGTHGSQARLTLPARLHHYMDFPTLRRL